MRILFISSWYPNKIEPTNGNFVQRHAEAVALLHDVEVIHAIGNSSQSEKFVIEDREINSLRTVIVYYKNTRNPLINFVRRMQGYYKAYQHVAKPQLIHANILHNSMLFAVFLRYTRGIPYVLSEHWSKFLSVNRSKLSFLDKKLAQFIANRSSAVFPVSNDLLNNLEELNIGKNHHVVGNVVDTELFKPVEKEYKVFRFLHISNLVDLKNPDKIINIAVRLRQEYDNFELQIGGDGDISVLNNMISEHQVGSYIKTFDEISHQEVAQKMRESDCFVLFSDYENLPCVLLESLSSGVPVIATKVGGIPELINEKYGLLIQNSDEDLYIAMKKMLEGEARKYNPQDLYQYVEENFSQRVIAQKFSAVYENII